MGVEETAVKKEIQREPFFKRMVTNIADWFVTKGKKIKTSFLTYIKSKETHKIWIRRIIVVAVIVLIFLSFRVKEYFKLYPYSQDSYMQISVDRETFTTYSGSSADAFERLTEFFDNVNSRVADKLRFELSYSGYRVIEDLTYDGNSLTLTIDNTKNKTLAESERIKTTKEYDYCEKSVASNVEYYKVMTENNGIIEEYVIAKKSIASN